MSFDFEAYRAKKRHTAREKAEYILACEELRGVAICNILDDFGTAIERAAESCAQDFPDFVKDIEKIERKLRKALAIK